MLCSCCSSSGVADVDGFPLLLTLLLLMASLLLMMASCCCKRPCYCWRFYWSWQPWSGWLRYCRRLSSIAEWIPAIAALCTFAEVHAVDDVLATTDVPVVGVFYLLLAPSLLMVSLFLLMSMLSVTMALYLNSHALTDYYYQTDHFCLLVDCRSIEFRIDKLEKLSDHRISDYRILKMLPITQLTDNRDAWCSARDWEW